MTHTQLSTGFRRLAIVLGVIAALGFLVLVWSPPGPAAWYQVPVLIGVLGVVFGVTWAVVRLIGWTVLGFYRPPDREDQP